MQLEEVVLQTFAGPWAVVTERQTLCGRASGSRLSLESFSGINLPPEMKGSVLLMVNAMPPLSLSAGYGYG
jgi:hypothetical protein